MAQFKTAIFIGRDHPDTGLSEYKTLAQRFHLKLDIHTHTPQAASLLPGYDIAFVSRYLTILEALAAGIPVLAHYNNQIKYDYLTISPFISYIKTFTDPNDLSVNLKYNRALITNGQKWAQSQTWPKLAAIYEQLWQK